MQSLNVKNCKAKRLQKSAAGGWSALQECQTKPLFRVVNIARMSAKNQQRGGGQHRENRWSASQEWVVKMHENIQLIAVSKIAMPKQGDFFVDTKYTFEVGGKDKSIKQIAGIKNAWVVKDDLEFPIGNELPLWMFGCLY